MGLSLTVPLMVACLSIAIPIWIRNGYQFWSSRAKNAGRAGNHLTLGMKEGVVLFISFSLFAGSILALGAIVSAKPLDDLDYKGWTGGRNSVTSPYASSVFLGWAMASAIALVVTGVLPIISWFATYRFSLSSAICIGIFAAVIVAFCGVSYFEIVGSRTYQIPTKADFLASLLPLICIPAVLSLGAGLFKWKDDNWKLSRGAYMFIIIGLLLLLGAISAIIVTIKPWAIGAAFLLVLLLLVLAIGVIHYWASNNFYLTRIQMLLVCFLAFLLALAAFLVGWFQDKAFVGASVGYFSFLFLVAGRALTVLLSPPIVVYSPRVLPVYVYDAHADCGKNVSAAFLVLYGIALAIEGWGVVASLQIYPPFAGAAVSAITLVVAFGFAVSRPCLTLEMVEDAVHFLSKETMVQAIARSATKTRNALSGTYSAPQRSASSAALLVGDPTMMRDRGGNFVLPRADVMKLRDRLRNEELAAGSIFSRLRNRTLRHEATSDVGHRREMCAHARILALEEAIDTEWVYMWDKFGGYLLLLLGLTAKAERVQDEVRLLLFLDNIGFPDLSAKDIKKWLPEDRRRFEIIQESYMREKEMEEEILMQRREEEGRGKERRKALLEKEERKWKEIEASLISSFPNAGNREAAAMAAAVRAVGGDSVLDDSFARERVSSIARRIRAAQLSRRTLQADSWQSGSISFGRFENEALCWERRSSFTHNKYLEEVEKCSKPGSVTEKKAYFEERFRRRALLSQSSSDCQNGADSQASYDGPENTDYEGDFEHVNEIGHSTRFVENHDRAATLLENGEYQASKNEGYAEHLEHVNEVVHSARFDENHGRSTRLSKNGKYQSENTGYGGDFERVNEVGDSARFEESFDGSNNGDIEVTECGREGSSNGDIEVTKCGREGSSNGDIEGTECGSEDNIISHSGRLTEQYTCSSDVLQSVLKHLEAEAKFNLNAGNAAFNDPKPTIEVKEKLVGQDSSIEFSSNSVDLSSNAHTTEKDGTVSSKPRRSSSSKVRTASQSRDTKSRMLSQVNVASVKGTISNQAYKDMPRKPNRRHSDVSLTQKREKPRLNASGTLLRPTARMPKPEVSSGSKSNVLNQHKSTEQQAISRKVVASRSSCTKKVSHRLYQSVSRDKESVNSFQPGVKQNGSSFHFKSEERAMKRKEFFMKLEEKVHAKEEEMHQLQARTQEKKEAEIKQLRRNLNFKATPMPSFYREPGRRAEKDKESASKTKSSKLQSRPSTAGARATSATDNTVRRSRAEVYNRCSTNERLNVSDSPQVSEATVHPSAELSDSSVPPSAPTSKTSKQTQSNRTVAPKRDQEKRQVTNSPRPRTSDSIRRSKDFKSEDKTKVVARRTGNHALRKDVRSVDLSHSTRVGRLAVGVAY